MGRLQNNLTGQFQLLERTRHQMVKHFQLIDSPRQLSEQIQLTDSSQNQLSTHFQLLDSL